MKKTKNIIIIVLCCTVIFGFSAISIFKAPNKYSDTERRTLSQKPEINYENLVSGKFMTDFEDYTLDQFPFRDSFRGIKSALSLYLFRQKATHNLYVQDGYISKLEYPANMQKIELSTSKLNEVYDKTIKETDCRVYLSIIPDKNYFSAPIGGYPTMDYPAVISKIKGDLSFADYIDIFPCLELSDYYFTDQHWRQEKVVDVAEKLVNNMGGNISGNFIENKLETKLYGAYVGQLALKSEGDTLNYLTDNSIDNCKVTSYSSGKAVESSVYNFKKAEGKDAYEFFLSGSEPLLTIENPNSTNDKELVIFRDSFTSSLAPLMISAYSKITLIDLRYIKSDLISSFVKFDNQDVLFLYSTLIFNNNISM